jgi:hypothetical protein
MNKILIRILFACVLASAFCGCSTTAEEASNSVPWGAPAPYEGSAASGMGGFGSRMQD